MLIQYRHADDYLPVDLGKLRPGDSYGQLLEKRSYPIYDLLQKHGRIPPEFLQERNCPACDGKSAVEELEKDHQKLVRCTSCDVVYVNPIFDEDHYKQIYDSKVYQSIVQDLGEKSHDYRVERFGNERVAIMKKYLSATAARPRYLDIGCSSGFVVEAAKKAGWDAMGLDLNSSAIEFGKKRGLNLHCQSFFEMPFEKGSFDAISLFDVLEHVTNPRKYLERASELLKPGGIAFVYVPNYDSASRMLMGKDAHFIWPTHHLTYFNIETLSALFKKLGLEVELVTTEGLDIFDYLFYKRAQDPQRDLTALEEIGDRMQFFVNAGGYGKNLRLLARKP